MTVTLLLATAITVRGLQATTGAKFDYKLASKVSACTLKVPEKAHSKSVKSIPDGLTLADDSKITGTVTAGEGRYTFGVACKEKKFNVTINVREPE